MQLKDKLKLLRRQKGMTQEELSKVLKISPTAVSAWERGANKPLMDKLVIMSELFDVPLLYFFDVEGVEEVVSMTKIPVIGTIACGEPILAEENIEEYREEITAHLPTGDLFYLRTKGDSMTPTIPEGSYVLIRVQSDVEDGEIAAVLVNGDTEATLKRVKRQNGMVLLMADNQNHAPYIVTSENTARILGKAVSFSADL